jgi:hypothetical protein
MNKLKLAPLLLVAIVALSSCVVYQPRQKATGAWLTHATQSECLKSEGIIGDTDSRRPYYFGIGRSYYAYWTPWGNWDCAQQWGRPRGYVAARWETYKWLVGPINDWAICRATNGWTYNTEDNIYMVQSAVMEPVGVDRPPCGAGTYYVVGCGAINNNGWHGGCVMTDQMYFPG